MALSQFKRQKEKKEKEKKIHTTHAFSVQVGGHDEKNKNESKKIYFLNSLKEVST